MEETIEEIEARLYAQVYHDTSTDAIPETSDYLPLNVNKQSKKRYWQNSNLPSFNQPPKNYNKPFAQDNQSKPTKDRFVAPEKPESPEPEEKETATPAIKAFVPYSSVLSFMVTPVPVSEAANNYEKKKNKATKFPKAGKVLNPLSKQGVTKGKSAMRVEVQAKKQKATVARKKAQNKVVATIELPDSDESDSDCIPIELPPPPLITLDSSDEETIRKKRAMSPSTSSIISDDFIVAGDKRRLANPFKSDDLSASKKLRKIAEQKATLERVKELTKVPSSSSDSARSSSERLAECKPQEVTTTKSKRQRHKERNSLDKSNEDSIYGLKASKVTKQTKEAELSSSEEETLYVNAKNVRRRKSTSSRKKSTDGDHSDDADEDSKMKLISSTPVVQETRRSRYITPNYNEDEFATLISTIINPEDELEDEDEAEVANNVPTNATIVTIPDSTVNESTTSNTSPREPDCEIVEQPVVVYEVPDANSDSDDSMRGFNKPIECDLSLNVTEIPYDPHEYIRDRGESSQSISTHDGSKVNPEIGWNDEMKFFYDGSWGDESFCISNILGSMPRDQKLWKISNADRNRTFDSGCRVRCKKCNEMGHYAAKCNKPKKRVVCFMCGEEGHRETRCPNSICLRCGKASRMFTSVCTSCNKWTKKYCPLCHYQGHDIEQCPDKWRRYHSTTTDTPELNSECQINKRVYCSICAKRGHFAETCNQFLKTISGLITSSSTNITSYKPSYPHHFSNFFTKTAVNRDQDQLLNLLTYFPFFRFNFQFNRNVRLYPKFLEQFKAHMKRTEEANRLAIEDSVKEKKLKKKHRKREAKKAAQQIIDKASQVVDENQATVLHDTSHPTAETHEDSNSNYSFTEFYRASHSQAAADEIFKSPSEMKESSLEETAERAKENVFDKSKERVPQRVINPFAANVSQLADFIPLSNNEAKSPLKAPIVRQPEEVRNDVRMLLTKEHFQMLSSQKGQNFLFDLQSRLNLLAQFKWDSTGNSLLITGLPSDQSLFHVEVREFLYKIEFERHEKNMAISSMLPKTKERVVAMLKFNLQSISKVKMYTVKKTLTAMIQAEKSFDHKKALKCRKTLNIAFIGDAELENGGEHIGALRRITYALEKDLVQGNLEMNQFVRDEISEHMKPIFSTMDHGDYNKLFSQYTKIMSQRRKRGMLLNPVIY